MAQKLDRSYFGDSSRSTTNRTTERQKESASSSGGTVQKLDRSYFNKPKVAPTTGAVSPAKKTTAQSNSTSRQQWTATNGGRKSTTNAGKKMQGTTVNNKGFSGSSRKIEKPTIAERVGNTIKGGAKSSAAAYTNVGGTLAEGSGYANTRIANYNNANEQAGAAKAIQNYNVMLKSGKWADGKALTANDRKKIQGYIAANQRKIDAHKGYTEAVEASDQEVADKAYRKADELAASAEKDLNRAKAGAGTLGRILVDAGASMTQTGLDAIPSILTGGALGMAPFAVRAFGGAAQQARQDGADYKGQLLYGTASAAKEVFTEKMFNIAMPFAKAYGGGALDDVVERGIRSAVDKFAKTEAGKKALGSALTFGAGAVGEGLEEFIGDWMEWQLPRIYGGDVATAQETLSNSLYDFLVGATSGAMGGLVSPNTYRYDLGNTQAAQQGAQERTDVQEGTHTAPAQTNAQTQQEGTQRAIQEAAQRRTVSNPVSAEEQVLRQREAAVQKTFTGIADKLGDSGRKAFQTAYQGTDRGDYAGEFLRAYHAGMTNQENPNSTSAVSFAAYAAGQNDAAASLAREKRAAQFAKTAGTDSGLVFDDYVSREMDSAVADEVNAVSKALGVRTRMVDRVLGGQANGQINGSDILIAKDAADPALQVVGHEWTHRVQELAPEQYRAFRDTVTSMPDVQEAANILLDQYNRAGVETSYEQALDEATANYAGEMIANSDVLDDFIRKHSTDRTLLQKLRDAIHEIVGKLTGRAKRQAQTVEGKLQAAFEAASKQAESLNSKNTATEDGETRYSFAGEKAKNADLEALRTAQEMEKDGADTETIRQKTGWFRGADGKWRWEIDDSGMEFRRDGDAQLLNEPEYRKLQELTDKWAKSFEEDGTPLSASEEAEMSELQEKYSDMVWDEKYLLRDFLKHDKLFKEYPYLNRVSLVFDELGSGENGYFDKRSNTIVLSDNLIGTTENTLIHEIQHVIQKIEGFANGSSPKYWNERMENGYSKRWASGEEMMPSELYRNTAGEIEARDAAARRSLTAEERKNRKPNTGDENTVFADGGESYSIGEIEGDDKKKYGVGVHLDSTLLENLTPKERTEMVKERIRELGGEVFTAYDQTGSAVDITIAKPEARFTNRNGKKIAVNKDLATKYIGNETKQEAVVLVDELIETAKFDKSKSPKYSHDWLDNNGKNNWDYWTTFIQDKNGIIWEATLNVANAASGEKILYDISPIKKVGQSVKSDTSLLSNTISKSRENVNENFSLKGTENAQEIAALKRENESLKERVEYWKGQTRRSQGVTTDRKSVQKAADALVKDYGAEISGSDIAGDLQSLYDYIASGKDGKDELTYAEARRRSDAIAERIAESAVEVDDRAYKEYAGLRKYLKDTKLTLAEADAAEITDFNEFRKEQFGKLKIGKGEHTNVDQIYSELSSQYPEFFSEQRETNISDQVQRIADVANQLYSVTEYNPFEGYMGQAVASISNDIMDRFFDLPQTKKTFADRAAEQVQEARFAGKQAASDAFLAGQMAQGRQDAKRLRSTAQALAKERTRRAEQVQALKERYREKDVTRRDSQKRRELRAKITRHASALSQKLLRPTDTQHIPEKMRSAVAKVLESINQESSPNARSFTLDPVTKERIYREKGTPTNRTAAFQNLKEQYQQIAKEGDMVVDPSLLGDEDVAGGFSEVIKMGDTRLADLTTEQLQTMWNVLKSVEHSVTTAGKTLASEKFETTKQFADALRMDGMTRRRKLGNNVAISLETPYTFFAHFGQTGKDIYRMLRNAQDQQEIMARDVAEKVQKVLGDTEKKGLRSNAVTAMNEETHHFTTAEGQELTLTTAQAMDLYLLSERKQAEDHLLKGGIVQPEIKIPGKTKIPRGTDVIHLSAEDIQSIVKALTPEQIRIADGLQKLTTGTLANYGNEASMKAYGYKKFTEQDYWPIRSTKEALKSSTEKDSGNVRSIKNIGMAQAVKPGANTTLEVRSVFSTFADHASDMIDYAAWLCPMEDANRLYNFQFRDSEGNLVQTVKGFLEEKGGQGSQQYWQKLMGDIQNGIKTKDFEPLTDKFAKGIGGFKGAAVGANLRVVIQQPTAFFRASAVLDPADMAKGLAGGVTKGNGWEKAVKYSPIAMRKDVGSFDISSPYTLNDLFYGKEGIANKINDKAGAPAGKADAVTWGALWNACEWQVKRERPNLRAGSGEFYSAVNEVFTNMIDQTQVVDGILQRSNIMRGKSDLAKQATSFMGEPIMSLNVFMRAWDNMRYEENPAKRSKAIKTVGRAAAALLVTDVVNALAQSIADAGRDDDPDKDYWEKFLAALTGITGDEENAKELLQHIVLEGNLGSNINKVGNVPFVKDILSLVQGYSVSRTDMQVFSDIVSASKDFMNSMGGSGKKTRTEAITNMFAACSKLFGLPVSNIKRDTLATIRTVVQSSGNVALEYEFEKLTYNIYSTSNKDRYMGLAFKALEQGDLTTYEHIRKELKDFMAVDSTSVDSGMRSRLEKKQEKDGDYRLPQNAASLIGAKDSYDDSEGEDKFTENDLSSDDYIVYSRRKSELYSSVESGLKDSQTFQKFTGEQKDKALSSAETYAKKTALHEVDNTYEITDKWILKAQEAQKKYGIDPAVYVALKTQVSEIESVKDRNGETIPNSKGLLIMQAVYNTPGLHENQRNALFEYLGVGKSIRHYNKALVNEKVRKNAQLAGK